MDTRDSASGPPPTVVIVDDDPRFLEILSDMLAQGGDFTVVGTATNGLDAINIVDEVEPDVVVLDVQMPGQNGFQTADALLVRRPDLSVVMTSGTAEDAYNTLSDEAGAVGFVPKRELSCEVLTSLMARPA